MLLNFHQLFNLNDLFWCLNADAQMERLFRTMQQALINYNEQNSSFETKLSYICVV